jgi:hypothetical protein
MNQPAYRTVITSLAVVAMQLAAFIVGTRHGWTGDASHSFDSLCMWSCIAAIGQAGKSAVESLAQGSGLKGAAAAILTDAKPGDPVKP